MTVFQLPKANISFYFLNQFRRIGIILPFISGYSKIFIKNLSFSFIIFAKSFSLGSDFFLFIFISVEKVFLCVIYIENRSNYYVWYAIWISEGWVISIHWYTRISLLTLTIIIGTCCCEFNPGVGYCIKITGKIKRHVKDELFIIPIS